MITYHYKSDIDYIIKLIKELENNQYFNYDVRTNEIREDGEITSFRVFIRKEEDNQCS